MAPAVRKFALTAHVAASVGWLGAVGAFLVLAVAGLTSRDAASVRAAYLAMGLITTGALVPLAVAAFATGVVQALGTPWGLLRHYWVLAKLLLTGLALPLLLLHGRLIRYVAHVAAGTALQADDLRRVRIQLTADAAAALVVLLVTTALSIYKPRGVTPYGYRKQHGSRPATTS